MELMYWISVLGALHKTLEIITIIFGVYCVLINFIGVMVALENYDIPFSRIYSIAKAKIVIPLGMFFSFAFCFVPSRKELLEIFAIGSTIEYVQGSEEAKKLPENILKLINDYLEEDKVEK